MLDMWIISCSPNLSGPTASVTFDKHVVLHVTFPQKTITVVFSNECANESMMPK
jgi:hypothetical protein